MDLNELQDQMTVLAAIQQRQSEVLKLWALETDAAKGRIEQLQQELDTLRATSAQRMAEWHARIEKLISGFGAFLIKVSAEQK
jgi:formate dehydrogenase maturation protein FdhE